MKEIKELLSLIVTLYAEWRELVGGGPAKPHTLACEIKLRLPQEEGEEASWYAHVSAVEYIPNSGVKTYHLADTRIEEHFNMRDFLEDLAYELTTEIERHKTAPKPKFFLLQPVRIIDSERFKDYTVDPEDGLVAAVIYNRKFVNAPRDWFYELYDAKGRYIGALREREIKPVRMTRVPFLIGDRVTSSPKINPNGPVMTVTDAKWTGAQFLYQVTFDDGETADFPADMLSLVEKGE